MSSDGSIIKNTLIKRSFVFGQTPENMSIYAIAYYDIFEGSDFDKEMEANLGALLDDADLSKILIGKCKSEIVFREREVLNEAAVFLENPPSVSNIGQPYMDEILKKCHELGLKVGVTSNFAMKISDNLIEQLVKNVWVR